MAKTKTPKKGEGNANDDGNTNVVQNTDRNEEGTSVKTTSGQTGDVAAEVVSLRSEMEDLKKLLMTSMEEREAHSNKNNKEDSKRRGKKRSASGKDEKVRTPKAAKTGFYVY